MNWNLIESAPEATSVLVWVTNYGPCVASKTTTQFGETWWSGEVQIRPSHWSPIIAPGPVQQKAKPAVKDCTTCGAVGCDHKDVSRCGEGYRLWEPRQLHPDTESLVQRFAAAMRNKLARAERKYGYSNLWMNDNWMDECRAKLVEHLHKGDPLDVANYCAFLWHHGAHCKPVQEAKPEKAQPISDAMMDLVDRLGSEWGDVDHRAWEHLLVYAPKPEAREPVAWRCEAPAEEWDELNYDERDVVIFDADILPDYEDDGYTITPFYLAPPTEAAIRTQALEDAAKVVEQYGAGVDKFGKFVNLRDLQICQVIRAMKEE